MENPNAIPDPLPITTAQATRMVDRWVVNERRGLNSTRGALFGQIGVSEKTV